MDTKQRETRETGYGNKFLRKWLPLYLVVGGIVYAIIYFAFLHHGGGGGGGY